MVYVEIWMPESRIPDPGWKVVSSAAAKGLSVGERGLSFAFRKLAREVIAIIEPDLVGDLGYS